MRRGAYPMLEREHKVKIKGPGTGNAKAHGNKKCKEHASNAMMWTYRIAPHVNC